MTTDTLRAAMREVEDETERLQVARERLERLLVNITTQPWYREGATLPEREVNTIAFASCKVANFTDDAIYIIRPNASFAVSHDEN